MIEAKCAEMRDLFHRDTFRDVLRTELVDDANLVRARYVLGIKPDKGKEE